MAEDHYLNQLKNLLGKRVEVKVDRPFGSYHPNHPNLFYSLNYGYIEDFLAPDGEYQDAYILGVNEPVSSFVGNVIAIIFREDDNEHKLVVAPKGKNYRDEEIVSLTAFQERFFHSKIIRWKPFYGYKAGEVPALLSTPRYSDNAEGLVSNRVHTDLISVMME